MSNRLRKHHKRHEDGGLDEIDIGGLSGVLPDAGYPNALLLDGSRAMTGNLDVAGNDILFTSVKLTASATRIQSQLRTSAALRDFGCRDLVGNRWIAAIGAGVIRTFTTDGSSKIDFQAYDTAFRACATLQNAAGGAKLELKLIGASNLPTADPADGTGKVWVDTGAANELKMGT